MKKITLSLVFILLGLSALWLMADPTLFLAPDLAWLHLSLLNYSGILAIGVMSVAMILALRIVTISAWLGGLDKAYRLHKWLGIASLVMGIVHWLVFKLPQWALGWGALEPPPPPDNLVLGFFQQQYAVASEIGDLTFKAFVILVALALIKRFPYRYFFKTHRLLAIAYLFLVAHSVMLMQFDYWSSLLAPVMVVLMAAGCFAAFVSLFRRIGHSRRVVGVIEDLVHLEETDVLKVVVEFKERWPGHEAGQFAFVTFDRKEGPHPFTIASPWLDNGKMFFLIKGLGDYTRDLWSKVHVGDYVEVEGPYGQFKFSRGKDRQIWIAGGIGIAPFVAGMKAVASEGIEKEIDLFYSTREVDETMMTRIKTSAEQAGIGFHVIVPSEDGRLDFQKISEIVPKWQQADVWFCGPDAFGSALKKDAVARGLSPDDFHQELFDMR